MIEIIIREKPEEHILNVGNVEAVSIKEWVTKCYESLGKIPAFVNVYEEIEQRNYFCFYNYEYYLDVSRQNQIYPKTIPLEDGLKDTAKWYLKHSTEVKMNIAEAIKMQLAKEFKRKIWKRSQVMHMLTVMIVGLAMGAAAATLRYAIMIAVGFGIIATIAIYGTAFLHNLLSVIICIGTKIRIFRVLYVQKIQ